MIYFLVQGKLIFKWSGTTKTAFHSVLLRIKLFIIRCNPSHSQQPTEGSTVEPSSFCYNNYMPLALETKLDFDRTVNTEDRFAIRRVLARFIEAINEGHSSVYSGMLSDAAIIEGFSDITQVKEGFVGMLNFRFAGKSRTAALPQLKLSYSRYLFHLKGTYEETIDGVLATEGTIEMSLIKDEKSYKIVRIIFYPRMRYSDDE
jgi:hypothetical protein